MIPAGEFTEAEADRLCQAATTLWRAERPLRVLRTLVWEPGVAERFLAPANTLPKVEYTAIDPKESMDGY